MMPIDYKEIIDFWFAEIDPRCWWAKDARLDQLIRDRYGAIHSAAAHCECYGWRRHVLGRLAEIIILDQFSRNIYRNKAAAFANDALALALAQEAISLGANRHLPPEQKGFLYLPFMHSESRTIHTMAVKLFAEPQLQKNLAFEYQHKKIIDRFGRYPHRNVILGRKSTAEESEFLKQPDSAF